MHELGGFHVLDLLCLIRWYRRRIDAIAYARYSSSYDELCRSTRTGRDSSDLDNYTNNHNSSTEEDGPAAAEMVAERENKAGTEEATDSVDGDDEALIVRISLDLRKVVDERGGRDNTGHDTLVITEEQEVGRSDSRDQLLHSFAGEPPVMGHAVGVVRVSHRAFNFSRALGDCLRTRLSSSRLLP